MKILLASNTAWYLWKFRLSLARALQAAGHEVVAAAPRDGHAAKLEAAGIRFVELPMDNAGMNPLRDLWLLVRMRALLRRERPGAFLGYTIKPNVYGGLTCRGLGISSIHNVSGLGTAFAREGALAWIAGGLYRIGLGRARRVFFQNAEDRAEALRRGLVAEAITEVLPGSGVDLERFAPVERAAPGAGEPVRFLLLARLIREYLRPHFRLLLIGFAYMGVSAAMTGALAALMQPIIDDIFRAGNPGRLWWVAITTRLWERA